MRQLDTVADPSPTALTRAEPKPASRWWTLPVLMAGTFVIVVDVFIVNVALPSIQLSLRASTSSIEWVVVAGYGLTFAMFLISAGRMADRVGRRRVFALGLGLFTLPSAGWHRRRPSSSPRASSRASLAP